MRRTICLLMLAVSPPAHAETAYVTERAPVVLRAALVEGSPTVKLVDGGAALEVLERAERFARVRDAQGAEGWIDSRLLMAAPPARTQLERMQTDLAKARAELATAQTQIGQLEAKLAQSSRAAAEPSKSSAMPPAMASMPSVEEQDFPWGWLVLAFAMLWLGFGAGIVWLRERNRKKLGGMYLRV
jgi:uncharacterized protein YgiM (DUF1202 family)